MTSSAPGYGDLLAAEYVIGVLPAAERAAFAQRLERELELRRTVWQWEIRLSGLADAIPEAAPPPAVKAALEARLFAAGRPASLWSNLWLWRGLSAGSLAALAVVALLYWRTPAPPLPGEPVYVAELLAKDASVRVIALYDAQARALRLDRQAGGRKPGRDMQLWLIDGKNPPQSVGLMPVDATGLVPVPAALQPLLAHAVLAISDEPAGGSPTGQPTGAVLAAGQVHSI